MPINDQLLLKILAEDDASGTIGKVGGAVDKMTASEKAAIAAAEKHGKSNNILKGTFTELNSMINVGERALRVAGQVIDATIGKTMAYAKQVRDLSTNLGLSAEETSKIIQASDDFGISVETVTSALQMMVKRGVAPSIEGLAQIADQYVATEDPIKRAALMTDLFGKSWTTLTPMLKEGGAALRASAVDAEAMGLVMSETDVQAARDLEIAMDQMSDRVQGSLQKIGKGLITLADNFFFMVDAISGESGKKMAATFLINAKNMQAMVKSGKMSAKDYNDAIVGMIAALNRWEITLGDKARAQLEWNTMINGFQTPGRNFVKVLGDMSRSALDVRNSIANADSVLDSYYDISQNATDSQKDFAKSLEDSARAADDTAKANDILRQSAINMKTDFFGLAGSLVNTKDKTTIASSALDQLNQMALGGALDADQLAAAQYSAGMSFGIITKESAATAKGIGDINKLYADGSIGTHEYTIALQKLPGAAKDGIVTMAELGIKIKDTGKKSQDAASESGIKSTQVVSVTNKAISDNMLSVANATTAAKGVVQTAAGQMITAMIGFEQVAGRPIDKTITFHYVTVGQPPAQGTAAPTTQSTGPVPDIAPRITNNITTNVTTTASSPHSIADIVSQQVGRVANQRRRMR